MTPKQKAKELVEKFQKQIFFDVTNERLDIEESKGCALIAVEEVRFFHERLFYATEGSLFDDYLNKVKHEIEKL